MNRITRIFIVLTFIVSITTLSCRKEFLPDWWHDKGHVNDKLSNQIILEWSNAAFEAAGGAAEGHPLLASRVEAMMHIAIHDALNAITPVYEQYVYKSHRYNSAIPFTAVASAAHTVLKTSWPDSASMLDAKLSASLSGIPDGNAKTEGIALGMAANAILALRANDGANQNPIAD